MQYYSHYIWESGSEEKNPISVVLQQVRRGSHHYLLACVCDGRKSSENGEIISGYFTERLTEWFHKKYLMLLGKHRGEMHIMASLQNEIEESMRELKEYGTKKGIQVVCEMQGILLCDNTFWFFGRGECRGSLFNRRFNQKQRRVLCDMSGKNITYQQGRVQKNIGILLSNAEFGFRLSEEDFIQVLFCERPEDKKIRKGLLELWKEDKHRGGSGSAGAVFIRLE